MEMMKAGNFQGSRGRPAVAGISFDANKVARNTNTGVSLNFMIASVLKNPAPYVLAKDRSVDGICRPIGRVA